MSLATAVTGTIEVGVKPVEYSDNSVAMESMGTELDYKTRMQANTGQPFQTVTSMLRAVMNALAVASDRNTASGRACLFQMRAAIDAMLTQSPDRVPIVT